MGIVVRFPRRGHVRASSGSRRAPQGRADANAAKISSVTPASRAVSEATRADHHSDGILSRWSHLRADEGRAPISEAIASGVRHNAITDRNEWNGLVPASDMESSLGQIVLNRKAELSHDCGNAARKTDFMVEEGSTAHRNAFAARVKLARESRYPSQQALCDVLEIDQGKYKWYETTRYLPYNLVWRFCKACGVEIEWLITGRGRAPVRLPQPEPRRRKKTKPRAA